MQIGIIGAGNVGGALGTGWVRKGHKIRFGVRRPDGPEMAALLKKIGPAAAAGSVAEAAAFDAGPLTQARTLEPLAMLWIWLAVFGGMGTDFAFRLIRR
jgi:predicted dinucleotide-binding enzyme